VEIALPDLPVLSDAERSCLARYVAVLLERLDDRLEEIVLFGSVARGESWPAGMPIRSDLDLLVITKTTLEENTTSELLDATLPLFLECGRQIGPQFRTREQLESPSDDRTAAFLANLERDGICLYQRGERPSTSVRQPRR
jgi:predicted nucleotidyltransferase